MNIIKEFLSSGGKVSSKRVVTAASFSLYTILVGTEQFFGFATNPVVLEGLMYIVISGLGLTASEKFSKKDKEVKVNENGRSNTEGS